MSLSLRALPLVAGLLMAALAPDLAANSTVPAAPKDDAKVVILGFDGASHDLAEKFMAEGRMPTCVELAQQGTFAPFGSANPAESPVAWASLNTGQNPGKTNIFGFMRRIFASGMILPSIGYSRDADLPLSGSGASMSTPSSGSGASEGDGGGGTARGLSLMTLAVGGGVLLLLVVLLVVFGKKKGATAAILLVGGSMFLTLGVNAYGAVRAMWQDGYTMPSHKNDLDTANFWDRLDQAGKRSRILQAACNYPATGGPNTSLLAGLSVPDVGGNPGTWYIYTNSDWEFDRGTQNGGKLIKFRIRDKATGQFESRIIGPKQFVEVQRRQREIDDLRQQVKDSEADAKAQKKLEQQLRAASFKFDDWKQKEERASLKVTGTVDVQAGTIQFEVGDHKVTVKEGDWSDYLPVTFDVIDAFPVHATVRFHVSECNPDAESVRFYVPAVTVAADNQPPNMPITSPASFGKDLVAKAGYFDTIGWSCQTNAFKDEELDAGSFMSEIWETIQWRRKMLESQLDAAGDWDVLFQVFGTTDRVGHMTFRWYDEKHPLYDEAEANQEVNFGGKMVKLKDCIPEIYAEMDNTIKIAVDRIQSGALGDNVTLMIVADHGFSPFREEVELNAFLIEQGFLVVKTDPKTGEPSKSTKLVLTGDSYADWSQSKAYSLGIGTIYLNLKGREPNGIVDPADYDKVCDEILAAMKSYKNPNADSPNDPQVFKGAWRRDQFLAGPHTVDKYEMKDGERVCTEGPADIQVGFNYGYRVAWGSSLGGREDKRGVVFPNESRWSGDHTSVHPYLVRGVFYSNKKMGAAHDPHLQDIAPTVMALQGVDVPDDMDGWVIPLQGLEQAAQAHKGQDVNRASVKPPTW